MTDFSRRTGDLEVMSKPDIHLLALTYELELERNGGDWRIRKDPGQQRLNGKPPTAVTGKDEDIPVPVEEAQQDDAKVDAPTPEGTHDSSPDALLPAQDVSVEPVTVTPGGTSESVDQDDDHHVEAKLNDLSLDAPTAEQPRQEDGTGLPVNQGSDEDDSDGWITPSNLKAHQAKDAAVSGPTEAAIQETLQAALLTSDFAMQNVALRINLKCVSARMAFNEGTTFTN